MAACTDSSNQRALEDSSGAYCEAISCEGVHPLPVDGLEAVIRKGPGDIASSSHHPYLTSSTVRLTALQCCGHERCAVENANLRDDR